MSRPPALGGGTRLRHPLPAVPSAAVRTHARHAHTRGESVSPRFYSSHPSPATSSASTSSLQTPPDVLVNGSSVGFAKTPPHTAVNSWNGRARRRVLRPEEIRRRQRVLATLPGVEEWVVPASPPPSPKRRRVELDSAALAAQYRSAARGLKHSADARSSATPSYLAGRPTALSALEQLDAVLLFCYAFALDDAALTAGRCVAKNWISLFGLLRCATGAHAELGHSVLLGLCRVVESAVLRRLHAHDASLLADALRDDADNVPPMVTQQAADLARSDRLYAQSRALLTLQALAQDYPDTFAAALRPTATASHPATELDCTRALVFPIDPTSPIPQLVAFGRALLAEHARRNVPQFSLVHPAP